MGLNKTRHQIFKCGIQVIMSYFLNKILTHPHHLAGVLPPNFVKRGGKTDLSGFGVSDIQNATTNYSDYLNFPSVSLWQTIQLLIIQIILFLPQN